MSLMLDEIRQQPEVLAAMLTSQAAVIDQLRLRLSKQRPRLVVLAARGTSDNATTFGRYLIEITTGIPVSPSAPSVYTLYGAEMMLKDALVVVVSQSGESTDINMVLAAAKKAGAITVGITNEPDSTMAREAEFAILIGAGRERSVAATKTYSGQLMAMFLLAYALGAPITFAQLAEIPNMVRAALSLEPEVRHKAERFRFMEHAVVIGRGFNYANAFEWALKLMETCYVVAERFSSADLLHGPIAMVEASFPTFVFAPHGVTWPAISGTMKRLAELQAETFVITDQSQTEYNNPSRSLVVPQPLAYSGPGLPTDIFTVIPYIVPAQLFAACLAEVKGLNPDQPRALSKVTKTV
jgi:glutamine---fructose-6-phosphate transaminase (isomerizing)